MNYSIESDGSVSSKLISGDKFAYGKEADFRAFYMELAEFLYIKGFDDKTTGPDFKDKKGNNYFENVSAKSEMKKGELTNSKEFKRNKNMYEQKFIWIDNGDGAFDVEVAWEAKKTTGTFYGDDAILCFKMNLANRRMMNVEKLEGNNKKVLQDGTWEFRNELVYKNIYFKNKLKKIQPLIKWIPFLTEDYLKEIILEQWYVKDIDHDIELCKKKIGDEILGIITKHFS